MATCPEGHENRDGQRFCGECGTAIRTESEREPEGSKARFIVTEDIELPGGAGILRRAKIIEADHHDPPPSPGWYTKPDGEPGQRYWDGTKWTEFTEPSKSPPSEPRTQSSMSPWKVIGIVGAVIFLWVGGCSVVIALRSHRDTERSRTNPSATSETIAAPLPSHTIALQPSAAPTTTAPTALTTTLLGLTMPPGSIPITASWCRSCDYPHEEWESGIGEAGTVAWLRAQLPIGSSLEGVPWCVEDDTVPGVPMWMWVGGPGSSEIFVGLQPGSDVRPGHAEVTIEKRSDAFGCFR
jgi:hypothetical protein